MAQVQVTYWRDLPSLVVARDGDDVVKIQLAARFQEAIDEAAMRLGDTDADAYLAGWTRSEWEPVEGDPSWVAAERSRALEEQWTEEGLLAYLDSLDSGSR